MKDRALTKIRTKDLRGFSLLEVLIAMVVLIVAMAGLVGTQVAATHGLNSSGGFAAALDVATQRAESLVSGGAAALPAGCAPSFGYAGCLSLAGGYAPPEACTAFVDGPDIPLPAGVAQAAVPNARYRVDTSIQLPPDLNQQSASPNPPAVVQVYVCWQDTSGKFRQVQTSRLVIPTTRGV
ncbi:MAG: prepilin-type N-terminal cleavage/methylation domain-containing protein [Myxococcota bacterium]